MANTPRTQAVLLSLFPDNNTGLITPQGLRDFVVSVLNATDNPVTAFAKTLLDDADAATARTTLGAAATSHTHTLSQVTDAGTAAALNVPPSGNATSGQVVKGSDTRLSDSRTPTAHASTHASGGSDEITIVESQVQNLTDDLAAKLALSGGTMTGDIRMSGNHVWMNVAATGPPLGLFTGTGGGNLYMESGNIWMGGMLGEGGGFIRMGEDSHIDMTGTSYISGGIIIGSNIQDVTSYNSISPNNRKLYDSTEIESLNWENRQLRDSSNWSSVNWESRNLNDGTAIALDWSSRHLVSDDGSTNVFQWTGNQGYFLAPVYFGGQTLHMGNSMDTGGGTLNMGGGSITAINSLDLGSGSISGGSSLSMNAALTEFYGDLELHGYYIRMNSGGTGGGIDMDGGSIYGAASIFGSEIGSYGLTSNGTSNSFSAVLELNGQYIHMNSVGIGGGIDMDGGGIYGAATIYGDEIASDGLSSSATSNQFTAPVDFNTQDINMNLGGSGTGGGTLYMDGGFIHMVGGNIGHVQDFTMFGELHMQSGSYVIEYNGVDTVSNGVPIEVGTADLTSQSAAISATTLFTPTADGMFRISITLQVTQAATNSSVLGGATGVAITYTEPDGSVAQSIVPLLISQAGVSIVPATGNTGNTTTTQSQGSAIIYAKSGVAIQYAIGYTSVGATSMEYAAHLKCEMM